MIRLIVLLFMLAGCAATEQSPTSSMRAQVRKLSLDASNGSGVVVRPGLVLTAKHVAEYDGLVTREKGVKGVRVALAPETVDLGLIYYPTQDVQCPCVKLADSEARVDETVYIVGFPLGIAQVATVGHSEGVQEHVIFHGEFGMIQDAGRRLVLTTPAQPGNSGGGAFVFRNGEFQLVGIVVSVTGTPGGSLTFAIPLADIKQFLAERA